MTKRTSPSSRQAPPSEWVRVSRALLKRWPARVGLAWVGLLVLLAVGAPLIANSHPLLFHDSAGWSSPLAAHLSWLDVTLIVGLGAGLALSLFKPISGRLRFWMGVGLIALVAGSSCLMIQPREGIVLSQYREAVAADTAGQTWALHTLIPFSPTDRMRDLPDRRHLPPSTTHWMGTTSDGEDLASRMIHASRVALSIGFIATGIALVIGIIVGGVMGYFSGWVDLLGMRLVEIFDAIPVIYLLIMFVAFYGRNLYLMMAIIGLTSWVSYATFIRAEFLRLRQQDFVTAGRAMGLPLRSILFRHMLPNGITPVLVSASFGVASAILTESTLSFLGLGLVEEPSWGQMLNQARGAGGDFYWWIGLYPGSAIFLTVFAYNLIGEALRDAIDPHTQGSS